MAKDSCVILSNSLDLASVVARLQDRFGDQAMQVQGEPQAWQQIVLSRRKLFLMTQVTFATLTPAQLQEVQKRLKHVYASVHPENTDLHVKLMAKIATSRQAIEVRAPKGLRGLEDVVFEVADALDAVIFWEGSKMLNKKGHLVMDFEGKSGVGDLDVVVDSELLDRHRPVTEEGRVRKLRSEEVLKRHNLPINSTLPQIESVADAKIRTLEQVAQRALAVMLVAVKGEGLEDEIVRSVMTDYGIEPFLSPKELAFIHNPAPTQQDRINFCWRYESLATLLWALGYQAELAYPSSICDVPGSVTIIRESGGYAGFLAGAKMRSASEILDQNDLIYRLHWVVVDARLKRMPMPDGLEPGVIYERHYALNWLITYMDQAWDDVSTDT